MSQDANSKNKLSWRQKLVRSQTASAKRTLLEEIFQDMNGRRWQIYKINLVRGIFFGFGSVLGGTIVIAFLVWVLSAVGALVPFLSDFIQQILDAMGSRAS